MKKKSVQTLKLVKKKVSNLKVSELSKVKGGSGVGTYCNTWFDCWYH